MQHAASFSAFDDPMMDDVDLGAPYVRSLKALRAEVKARNITPLDRICPDALTRRNRSVYKDRIHGPYYVHTRTYIKAPSIEQVAQDEHICYRDAHWGGFSVPAYTSFCHIERKKPDIYEFHQVIVLAEMKKPTLEECLADTGATEEQKEKLILAAGYEATKAMVYFNESDRNNAANMFVNDPFGENPRFTHIDFEYSGKWAPSTLTSVWFDTHVHDLIGYNRTLKRATVLQQLHEMQADLCAKAMPSPVYVERLQAAIDVIEGNPFASLR